MKNNKIIITIILLYPNILTKTCGHLINVGKDLGK